VFPPFLLLIRMVAALFGIHHERSQQQSMERTEKWEMRVRGRLHAGDWEKFDEELAEAWKVVGQLERDDANLLATRLSLIHAEAGVVRGDPAAVRRGVESALAEGSRLGPSERREHDLQAMALAAIALDPDAPDPVLSSWGEQALARAGEALWDRTRTRLVQAAVQVGRVRRRGGEHAAADRAYTQALDLSRHLEVDDARVLASIGAVEVALHRVETGLPAEAAAWFDRAATIVEPATSGEGRVRLAHVMILRATHLPGDPLLDAPARRALYERARSVAREVDSVEGRQAAARAGCELAELHGLAGDHREAVASFDEAAGRLAALADPDSTRMRIEVRLACGQARLAAQDLEAARDFRLAFEEAAAREEPELRALALPAGFAWHRMHGAAGMLELALAVLDRLGPIAASLPEAQRGHALAQIEYERAVMDQRSGRIREARERLRGLLETLADSPGAAEAGLRRMVLAGLGHTALARGEHEEAADWFERVLAMDWPEGQEPDAERAELEWHHATALVGLGRLDDARRLYRQAFERGRASGRRGGRYASAQSAFMLAEHSDLAAEQKRWYEAASSLANLCGTPDGEQLARRAAERLRSRAAGEG
jgi:tetratricopeptide (TPR) repeat protein